MNRKLGNTEENDFVTCNSFAKISATSVIDSSLDDNIFMCLHLPTDAMAIRKKERKKERNISPNIVIPNFALSR